LGHHSVINLYKISNIGEFYRKYKYIVNRDAIYVGDVFNIDKSKILYSENVIIKFNTSHIPLK